MTQSSTLWQKNDKVLSPSPTCPANHCRLGYRLYGSNSWMCFLRMCIERQQPESELPRQLAKYSLISDFATLLSWSPEASLNPCQLGNGACGLLHRLRISCSSLFRSPIPSPAPRKRVHWPPKEEVVLRSTSVSDSYTISPLNTSYTRPVGSGSDSWSESRSQPMRSVCVSRTWLANGGYRQVLEARIMFTLACVVSKCFSYAAV